MSPLALDPHPFGCPLGLACTPSEMPDRVLQVVLRLRDLTFPTVHVVNPSRGASYPILNLYAHADDPRPRVVLFPGWEDDRASVRRRLDYGRQLTLLRRIHDAGVPGEQLEQWHGDALEGLVEVPFEVPMAVTAPRMVGVAHELFDAMGDLLRITVATVPRPAGPDLHVVRLYAPNEARPRLILFPGWWSALESPRDRVDPAAVAAWLQGEATRREIPVEALRRAG